MGIIKYHDKKIKTTKQYGELELKKKVQSYFKKLVVL